MRAGIASTVNFDGIPGPTHNYAGLARGNLAAERHASLSADPRAAALQGLAKMRALAARGHFQAVLPPHERPLLPGLRALGFSGSDAAILAAAAREAPRILAACSSASAMWAANAATVSASADTRDGRVHLTPANLVAHFHRALETVTTTRVLRAVFSDTRHYVVHEALAAASQLADEGAANHMRLVSDDGKGINCLVHGRSALLAQDQGPARFPARQTREASEAIARRHGLDPARTLFPRQLPAAIDAGVFHNDVIAVAEGSVLFCHEQAFVGQPEVLAALGRLVGEHFVAVVVRSAEVAIDDAVSSYLFNSQLLARPDGRLLLLAPADVLDNARVRSCIDRLLASGGPIAEVQTLDLRQSMRNGGGPACLRLGVPLTDAERAAIGPRVMLDAALADELERWILRHYRDRLAPADLADPALLDESRRALDELTRMLRLPAVYAFQQV